MVNNINNTDSLFITKLNMFQISLINIFSIYKTIKFYLFSKLDIGNTLLVTSRDISC